MSDRTPMGIVQITSAMLLAMMLGYLLIVGQSLILPILMGIMAVYILTAAAEALARVPGLGGLSQRARRWLTGVLFFVAVLQLIGFVAANAQAIISAAPGYSENLRNLVAEVGKLIGVEKVPTLDTLITRIQSQFSMSSLISQLVGGLTSTGAFLFSAILYAAFLLADWNDMPRKTRLALGDDAAAETTLAITRRINQRIGAYLASKTLINIILGALSLAVMWALGIEFALFWAILIALLNYIPYIGSILGVLFPTALTLVQFPTPLYAVVAFVALMGAQVYVGNVLEPRMLGRSVNMSPFVLLIALSFWMSIWGVIGAILAIPLTSMIMIILAEIPPTRPIAVMMSGDGEV